MKDKLRNALDNIDERFIEEAAEAGRSDVSSTGRLKFLLIPAGAVAAAAVVAVCVVSMGKPRGVDLIAQSSHTTEQSGLNQSASDQSVSNQSASDQSASDLDTSRDYREYLAFYECEDSSLNFDTEAETFVFSPCDVFSITPTGTFTLSNGFITLDFTQLDDVKYRGRLSSDSREITIVNPDERLYNWIFLNSGSEAETGEAENAPENPEVVFKWCDGAVLGGSAETVESVAETEEAVIEAGGYSPDNADKLIRSCIETYSTESQLDHIAYTAEYRRSHISEAMALRKGPLDMDNLTVTAYSGYDEWTGGNHYGIDLASPDMSEDTVVTAFMDGTVEKAVDSGSNYGLGKYIVINHGAGIYTVYANLSSVDVSYGQPVSAGDEIGHIGSSGSGTGLHLHFEIRENGEISSMMNSYPQKQRFTWIVGGEDGGEISELMDGQGGYYGHKGIDIAAGQGAPVYAADDGTVILAEWYYGYGNCVMIDHGDLVTVYGHLDEISVSDGQQVEAGEAVGTVGSTGYVTGYSLHFEVRSDSSEEAERLNPLDYLPYHKRSSAFEE